MKNLFQILMMIVLDLRLNPNASGFFPENYNVTKQKQLPDDIENQPDHAPLDDCDMGPVVMSEDTLCDDESNSSDSMFPVRPMSFLVNVWAG